MLEHAKPEYAASDYWQQELAGFAYMLDASPLIVDTIRHHSYHLTGLYEYFYRKHHVFKAKPYKEKLDLLKALDRSNLRVSEARELGGFGYEFDGELYNMDTLKFYEVLIGMDQTTCLEKFKKGGDTKGVVLEIGSGWGGFAYQFKTLFPNTSYVLVDFPQVLLFASVYLQTLFPKAKVYLGDGSPESYAVNFADYDFVFIPHYAWKSVKPQRVDLAVNMASFQEMTDAQVRSYSHTLADWKTPFLYSLNRDISPNNKEISGVSTILAERYTLLERDVLPVPYHAMSVPKPSLKADVKNSIKKLIGYRSQKTTREYRHILASLPTQL